ncbi:MAG: aminopeptidase P family protein [Candidatus Thermoplasmatota archaeon]|nr:aminopeptidase P family protein [Candidatus Thermoplasmatota archaeon]
MVKKLTNREKALKDLVPEKELPFSKAEYASRLKRIRAEMRREGMDVLYLSSPESMYYACGYRAVWYQAQSPKNWLPMSGVAVHADHDKLLMLDTEEELVMIKCTTIADDIRVFSDDLPMNMVDWTVSELSEEGWLPGTIGLEMWSYRPNRAVSEAFQRALERRGCRIVDASDILRKTRSVKSPRELSYVRRAAKVADLGMTAAMDKMRPGVTELQVYGEMVKAMAEAGGENPAITMPVASGRKSACAHALASTKKLRKGEIVNIDVCGVVNRYHADMARTFSIGRPDPEVAEVVRLSGGAFNLLRRTLRPNASVHEIMDSLKAYYKEVGIVDDRWWFGGYELGASFPPDWVGPWAYDAYTDQRGRRFVPGTVVNYESNFYLPKRAGLSLLINTLIFDTSKAQVMGRLPNELIVV